LGTTASKSCAKALEVVATVQSTEREASGSNSDEAYGAASFA